MSGAGSRSLVRVRRANGTPQAGELAETALASADRASADLAACFAALRQGSRSFSTASLLLPGRLRAPAAALYAWCRVADDVVDEAPGAEAARAGLRALTERLDALYEGAPVDHPADRAFARVVAAYDIPRNVPALLLEGFAWDLEGRRYESLSDVVAYGVRVAGTVGVMMTLMMGPRDRETLARAVDLGVAMQLTNIARDVGEDARMGRVYLPADWLAEVGLSPAGLVAAPADSPALAEVIRRLLAEADRLYRRADAGVARLPRDCRVAIRAARLIYAAIGDRVAARGFASVAGRARTGAARKLWLLCRATSARWWRARDASAGPALPEAERLLEGLEA